MLSLNHISRHYLGGTHPAVADVSLEVPEGETLALVGESGSGKTTLLRLIAGLETPDSGSVTIDNTQVATADGRIWISPEKRRVGFVFQDGALFPHLTVSENVGYGLLKTDRAKKSEIVESILETVGLNGFQKRFPHQLSGGERQRVAVARALAPRPKLILLDEPFSNLDPALRRNLREEIQTILAKVNATAIMVTHDTEDALAVADRIAVFRAGIIDQIGSPKDLYHNPASGYCARLFGPANCVIANGKTRWIRPEAMTLQPEFSSSGGSHSVSILNQRHTGRQIELTVSSTDPAISGGENWTIFSEDEHREFSIGDELKIALSEATASVRRT
ncbi:ABC transporter ATP-binding protein [Verrucomicrobiales bacterium]|nr:ABC transporter ATP-binding protein [Verrucomicrobiales bacterium]